MSKERERRSQNEVNFTKNFYPVERAISYGKGNYEFRRTGRAALGGRETGKKEKIKKMTKRSLIKLMFTMQCTQVEFGSMLTLTYPKIFPNNGEIVKTDINTICQKMRRKGWSYVWFLEFQKRGAPHVHFLLSPDCITPQMRAEFGIYWTERIAMSEWYTGQCLTDDYLAEVIKMLKFNCNPETFQLLRGDDGAKRYATKYAAKEKQKKVPSTYKNVGRFWGASADVKPDGIEFDVTEDEVEMWLIENNHPACAWELVPRYIWGLGQLELRPNMARAKQETLQ